MKDIEYIKTPDIDLASVLYCLGFPIDGIYASGRGSQMDFYFRDSARIKVVMEDYLKRRLRMEPSELFNTRKGLINKIKNEANFEKP